MRALVVATAVAASILLGAVNHTPSAVAQSPSTGDTITKEGLKSYLENMGYTVKDLNDGHYEIFMDRKSDNIYITVELSGSLQKVWLTSYYGELTDREKADPKFLLTLAEKNAELQPTHFFVTKNGRLKIGRPIDNRAMTPSILHKEIDRLVEDIAGTRELWERKK